MSAVEQRWVTGIVLDEIGAERRRQMEAEGWTPEHDDEHEHGELAAGAAAYAALSTFKASAPVTAGPAFQRIGHIDLVSLLWPFDSSWFKPNGRRRNLVKAAALLVAEIERLDRAEARKGGAA